MIQETNLKPYTIYHSENHSFPLVVSIPHSGTTIDKGDAGNAFARCSPI